jgi:myo-inositol 2-dehydrogenase / D-chiro-inositol 1-dehydrogenase
MSIDRNPAYASLFRPQLAYLPDKDRYLTAETPARYRFNVIGTGINGQEHIRVTHLEGRATVHGIYDPNPGSVAAAQREHARFTDTPLVIYDSLEAACQDDAADALIIATPNYTHIEVIKVAAKSGKPILLEKPIATTVQDAYEIAKLAENYPSVFQIGLQYRYKAAYAEAIYEVKERRSLGTVKTLSMLEHRIPFLDKVGQWNKFSEYSGDTLIEKCCHYFDLLNLLAGARPVRVYATGGMAVNFKDFAYEGKQADILDHALVAIDYQNGVRASFNLCMFAPMFYEELVVCGDAGRLKASEQEDLMAQGGSGVALEILLSDARPSRRTTPGYPALIEKSGHHGATFMEHVNFVNAVAGLGSSAATAREGLWSIIVAAAAQTSIKARQVVDIGAFLAGQGVEV